ncbi:MAG: hypothetical protein P4L46_15790 [Fimbriimonas sp.]|nr:hypothetical protein [Fimbriimonas sp.]
MKRFAYSVILAATAFAVTNTAMSAIGHRTFSGTMIASAISRFRRAHIELPVAQTVVATAARVDNGTFTMPPPKPKFAGGDQGTIQIDSPQVKLVGVPGKVDIGQKTGSDAAVKKASSSDTGAAKPTSKTTGSNGLISNQYDGQDIKSVISDVASLAGVIIAPDETIKEQNISVEFKNATIDYVLDTISMMAGAYWKLKAPGFYIVSKATPDSSLFREFAETQIYSVHNQKAASIQALLSASYKPYLSVDPSTNAIGVCAPPQLLHKILADITQADKPGRQIVVEALITEVSHENDLDAGFNFATNKFSFGTDLSLSYQKAGFSDVAKIQAMITNHKAILRANPRLMTIEGRESNVNVGTDTYFSLLSGSTTFPTSQIQLIHTGIILKFTGFIGSDGMITMHLEPEVSDAVVLQNGNPSSQVRRATTDVRVKSGETIIIGGLINQTQDNQVIRVPILGYIPILGEIFTQRTNTKKKIETIIMITPKIVDDAATSG